MTAFSDMKLSPVRMEVLQKQGIKKPTEIQVRAIPEILAGRDIIAQSQTGTGKTLAFLLPIFEMIQADDKHIQGLIITPTRELALQITEVANMLNANGALGVLALYGGQDIQKQLRKLNRGVHLIIATPGRLLDHMDRESSDFSKLKTLVLDEADQMLHLGFRPEVDMIMRLTPKKKQVLCFSATLDSRVKKIAYRNMTDPVEISAQEKTVTLEAIAQLIVKTSDRNKKADLIEKLEADSPFMAIIFCRTKRRVNALDMALSQNGYNCEKLHGDLTQKKRERIMKAFRDLKIQYLIATDVAARGLDISGVTHIYNYDMPETPEIYIHRIGRTGRAGETGKATTFVTPGDEETLQAIESQTRQKLDVEFMTTKASVYAEMCQKSK
jgi:superfamily II DNA/RNA helicase